MDYPDLLLIAGELREGRGDQRAVENPATGEVLVKVRDASLEDVSQTLAAARAAWQEWERVPEQSRAAALRKLADLIDAEAGNLARLLTAELGKPIRESEDEVGGTAAYVRHSASLLETRTDEVRYTANPDEEVWLRRRAHGVVAAIIPWNFPSALVTRKVGPALAAGNAIVLKADEKTPLSALALARIIHDSGLFPAGLVSVITGPGETVGRALVTSPDTDMVTMTGSPAAGKAILADAAALVKPVMLELGGKAPFIVLSDADLDRAVADAVASRHLNCGQVCIANERTFVHDSLVGDFTERYVEAVRDLVVADPTDPRTEIGPKVSEEELSKVLTMVEGAVEEGASVAVGGRRLTDGAFAGGYWMEPTVLTGVRDDMSIMANEVFGPVTPIVAFSSWEDVVARANRSAYGLSAYVYTSDLRTAMRASRDLSFGEIYVNRVGPEEVNGFHAGFRESGLGGDDGAHGLEGYFRKQTVYLRY